MLFLQLTLLAVLLPGGYNEDKNVPEPIFFRLLLISSFANQTWPQNQGSAWLDELQTPGWDGESGTIIFLRPWSKSNFSEEELRDLELLFQMYFTGFTREVQDHVHTMQFEYPLEIQVSAGCEVHSNETPQGFFHVAYGGTNFLSFQNSSWVPSPEGGSMAQNVCNLINQYQGIRDTVRWLIRHTCPRFILGLLAAGKMDLQRQVKPQAWISSSPTASLDRLLLVCHVNGFHPKPVWVVWMQGKQEPPGTKQGDFLPNADGTWYLWVSLDVAREDAVGLSCQVRHSSLGGQHIIIYWGHHVSMNLIPLAVIAPLILLIGLVLWFKKRW
ncbi:T-cell surface glycoprotein CD1c isoform X1 [Echinops telfairi]|uniref:T-cell surface glycoprotein CD1c isoform X1 n=1 Tax=Echinops telfairi TaxID=9371 RepID=A0ABM1VME2_ECHTE|nr:T-cell surface glycoprotein CD1c isoform X1 [Echinops telfairi]